MWMFTIPSLRAKECVPTEKEALNVLFLAVPLLNVLLPFVWKVRSNPSHSRFSDTMQNHWSILECTLE